MINYLHVHVWASWVELEMRYKPAQLYLLQENPRVGRTHPFLPYLLRPGAITDPFYLEISRFFSRGITGRSLERTYQNYKRCWEVGENISYRNIISWMFGWIGSKIEELVDRLIHSCLEGTGGHLINIYICLVDLNIIKGNVCELWQR